MNRYSEMQEYVDARVSYEIHNGSLWSPARIAVSAVIVFQGGLRERFRNAWLVLRG